MQDLRGVILVAIALLGRPAMGASAGDGSCEAALRMLRPDLVVRGNKDISPMGVSHILDFTDYESAKMARAGDRLLILYSDPLQNTVDAQMGVIDLRASGKRVVSVEPPTPVGPDSDVGFSPDGRQIRVAYQPLTGDQGVSIVHFDARTGEWLREIPVNAKGADLYEMSASGRYVVLMTPADSARSTGFDDAEAAVERAFDGLRQSPRSVFLVDSETGRTVGEPIELLENIGRMAFSPGDTRVAVSDTTGRVVVHSVDGSLSIAVKNFRPVTDLAFSHDAQVLLMTNEFGVLRVVQLGENSGVRMIPRSHGDIRAARFSPPDSSRIAVVTEGELVLLNLNKPGTPEVIIRGDFSEGDMGVSAPAWSPDGRWVFTTLFYGMTVIAWEATTGRPVFELKLPSDGADPSAVNVSDNGKTVLKSNEYGGAQVWDLNQLTSLPGEEPKADSGRISATNNQFVIEWGAVDTNGTRVTTIRDAE